MEVMVEVATADRAATVAEAEEVVVAATEEDEEVGGAAMVDGDAVQAELSLFLLFLFFSFPFFFSPSPFLAFPAGVLNIKSMARAWSAALVWSGGDGLASHRQHAACMCKQEDGHMFQRHVVRKSKANMDFCSALAWLGSSAAHVCPAVWR